MGECGLLRASFVPPEPIRQLRDLTRYRTTLAAERTREAQRLEKELEDAGIKLSTVATDILGVSGREMLAALIDGERDAQVLAEMAKARMRPKIPQLVAALTGNFGEHHAFLCRLHLERIDQLTAAIGELSARIGEQMRPFSRQLERLATIPGVGQTVAEVIVAETGADMSRFRTAGNLASWAGVCPGHHESAGKRKSGKTRHGNRWLSGALGTAAMAAARTKDTTYLGARYRRLVPHLGKKKPLSPWNTRSSPRSGTCSPTTPTTTISAETTSLGSIPNARCTASSDRPMHSGSPSASTPSRPPNTAAVVRDHWFSRRR